MFSNDWAAGLLTGSVYASTSTAQKVRYGMFVSHRKKERAGINPCRCLHDKALSMECG